MATIKVKGIDQYIRSLEKLDQNIDITIGDAIYDGADLVANNVKSALVSLPTDDSKRSAYRSSIYPLQKKGLIESFGIAKLRKDGDLSNVKLGFDGYNDFITYQYPMGQPNVMIARALESGTSFMPKNPIISKAVRASRKACINKMEKTIVKKIAKLMT